MNVNIPQANLDFFEWMTRWPIDKPAPKPVRCDRWRYYHTAYNMPTVVGIVVGIVHEPWNRNLMGQQAS